MIKKYTQVLTENDKELVRALVTQKKEREIIPAFLLSLCGPIILEIYDYYTNKIHLDLSMVIIFICVVIVIYSWALKDLRQISKSDEKEIIEGEVAHVTTTRRGNYTMKIKGEGRYIVHRRVMDESGLKIQKGSTVRLSYIKQPYMIQSFIFLIEHI